MALMRTTRAPGKRSLGLMALLTGTVLLVIAGLLLLWDTAMAPQALALGLLGAAAFIAWGYLLPEERTRLLQRDRLLRAGIALVTLVLMAASIAAVYTLVQRATLLFDITLDQRFTLSDSSLQLIDTVRRSGRQVQITAFYGPEDIVDRQIDDEYFRLYETESRGTIRRMLIDPAQNPGLASPYQPALEAGLNTFLAFVDSDGNIEYDSTIIVPRSTKQERDISQALSQLLVSGAYTVYFETSLGTLDPITDGEQSISTLNSYLRSNGVITDPIALADLAATADTIPLDASAVVLARPQRDPSPAEIAILDEYLSRGGSLFIMADINPAVEGGFMREGSDFSEYLLERFGLRPLDAVVVDPLASGSSGLDVLSYIVYSENPIGVNLNVDGEPDTVTQFRIARPIEVVQHDTVFNGRVIDTSEASWAETDFTSLVEREAYAFDEGVDMRGPLTTVAWAYNPSTEASILLVGDGDFAMNRQAVSPSGNTYLFMDGILSWLTDYSQEVTFAPQAYLTPPLFAAPETLNLFIFVSLVLMPGGMLALAGVFAWRRRA
jgi:hypothetical protein